MVIGVLPGDHQGQPGRIGDGDARPPGRCRTTATRTQAGPPSSSARPSVAPVRWRSTAAGLSSPPSTVCASASSEAASSELRAACTARRAARWTTLLTVTATVTNSIRASRFRGWSMVSVCSGGVKYQLISRLAPIAAATAGQNPPTIAMATTTTR